MARELNEKVWIWAQGLWVLQIRLYTSHRVKLLNRELQLMKTWCISSRWSIVVGPVSRQRGDCQAVGVEVSHQKARTRALRRRLGDQWSVSARRLHGARGSVAAWARCRTAQWRSAQQSDVKSMWSRPQAANRPKRKALRNLPMFPNIKYWNSAPCRGPTMTSTCTRNTCMIPQLSTSMKTTRQLTFRSASSQPNYKAENIIS